MQRSPSPPPSSPQHPASAPHRQQRGRVLRQMDDFPALALTSGLWLRHHGHGCGGRAVTRGSPGLAGGCWPPRDLRPERGQCCQGQAGSELGPGRGPAASPPWGQQPPLLPGLCLGSQSQMDPGGPLKCCNFWQRSPSPDQPKMQILVTELRYRTSKAGWDAPCREKGVLVRRENRGHFWGRSCWPQPTGLCCNPAVGPQGRDGCLWPIARSWW